MTPLPTRVSLLAIVLLAVSCTRSSESVPPSVDGGRQVVATDGSTGSGPVQRPNATQASLLGLAFRVASAIPVEPHVKSRSRAQESVLLACHELGLHELALEYAPAIDNWRRGVAHADLAVQLARSGRKADARHHVAVALRIGDESMKAVGAQEWRRDRIRAKVGCALLWLGDLEQANDATQGIAESELAELLATRAKVLEGTALTALEQSIPRMVETGNLDVARAGMVAAAALVDRFHDDGPRREAQRTWLQENRAKVPAAIWFELQFLMAEDALLRGQGKGALALVEDAATTLGSNRWLEEDRIANLGRLAALRARCGDLAGARAGANAALEAYAAAESSIVDIWRAKALRPAAEALSRCGDLGPAAAAYGRAVEAGVKNPNSRPRAEDLVATCLSMVLCGFEPPAELAERMQVVARGLGDPW